MPFLLSIDQGTTSTRAVVYDETFRVLALSQREFAQHYPEPGWVEHDAEEIWDTAQTTARDALRDAGISADRLGAIGITNQRETVVLWERASGRPLHRAIVWQDRRTVSDMEVLREKGYEQRVNEKTGLVLDPYFSASKISWLLAKNPEWQERAAKGELAAGTVDSWLAFRLSGCAAHITDITNASRTMLMNLRRGEWDEEMLEIFGIPPAVLPEIVSTSGKLATCTSLGGNVPLCGMVGDQQSALFGQLCTQPGQVKCTYGTGCFMLMHCGQEPVYSRNRLLSTVAWKIGDRPIEYALEGSVFIGGAAIQWLRDGLEIIKESREINDLAASVPDSGGVILVPAFAGLGAPHWDASARGAMLGLTRGTTSAHIARAALDGIAHQVVDLLEAMEKDAGHPIEILRVDGGASASDLLMQIQADLLNTRVERPVNRETTALGAAMMAGLGSGVWNDVSDLAAERKVDRVFEPGIPERERLQRIQRWRRAVSKTGSLEQDL